MARFYYEGEVQNFVFDNQLALELIDSHREEIRSKYAHVKPARDFLSPVGLLLELDIVREESLGEAVGDEGEEETEYSESEASSRPGRGRPPRSEFSDEEVSSPESYNLLEKQEASEPSVPADEYEELLQSINKYVRDENEQPGRCCEERQPREDAEGFGFFVAEENLRFLNNMEESGLRAEGLTKRDLSFQSSSSTEPYSCIASNWGLEDVEEFILFPLHTVEDAFADLVSGKDAKRSEAEECLRKKSHPEYPAPAGSRDSEHSGLPELNKSLAAKASSSKTALLGQADSLLRHEDLLRSLEQGGKKPVSAQPGQPVLKASEASKKPRLELVCEEGLNFSPTGQTKAMRKKQKQAKKKQEKKTRLIDIQLCKTNSEQTDLFDMSDIHRKASAKQEDERDSDEETEIFKLMEKQIRRQNEQVDHELEHPLNQKLPPQTEPRQPEALNVAPEVRVLATQPKKKKNKPKKKQAGKPPGKKEESGLSSFQRRLLEESPPEEKEASPPPQKKPSLQENPRLTSRLFSSTHFTETIHIENFRRHKQGKNCSEFDLKYVITNLKVTQSIPGNEILCHLLDQSSSNLRMKIN